MNPPNDTFRRGALRPLPGILLVALLLWLAAPHTALAQVIPVGLDPQGVAANPITNKVYVANGSSGTVTVIDGATNTTETVPAGSGPVAVAVNPVTNKIYVGNFSSADVTVIDGATNATETVPAGSIPRAVAVNPVTNKIYVANRGSNTVTVLDGADNSTQTVPVGASPNAVVVNPVTNKIYVANGGGTVTVIDGATNTTETVTVGSAGQIAVNPITNKVYVANFNSNTVTVIDGADNTVVETVPVGRGPNAVAVNPITNIVYVANINGNDVTVIDGADNTVVGTAPVGTGPNAVAVNPVTNTVYVTNRYSKDVTVIDGADNTVAETVLVEDHPQSVAINPITNKAYVTNLNTNNVTVIDGRKHATEFLSVYRAGAVAANPATGKIYVANYNSHTITVIDGADNTVVATVPVGTYPNGVAVNPVTNKIYVANRGSANVTVIDGADNTVVETVAAGSWPLSVAVNPATNKVYVANRNSGTVTVIDGSDNSTQTVAVGSIPEDVAVNPVTNKVYVANFVSNTVTVIDGSDNSTQTVAAGANPTAVAVNPVTNRVYVSNRNSNNVTVIDGATNATETIAAGAGPEDVAVNSVTNTVYVANYNSSTVTVIDGADNTTETVTVGVRPYAVKINPVTNTIYVVNFVGNPGPGTVSVIDGATNTTKTVPVGREPGEAALNPVTGKVYVSHFLIGTLAVITPYSTPQPLTTAITPLPDNATIDETPSFPLQATSAYSPTAPPVQRLYVQFETTTGPWMEAATGPTGSVTAPPLAPGEHWVFAFATDGQEAGSSTVGDGASPIPGEVAAYYFVVQPPTGTIVIATESDPAGGTGFSFTDDIEAPNSLTLDDGQTKTFTDVTAGSYTVTEAFPGPTYELSALTCDDANSTEDVASRTAMIELEAGETVTCTFTNSLPADPGTIVIKKETDPADEPGSFTFSGVVNGSIGHGGKIKLTGVAPGQYTVTEDDPAAMGFTLTAIDCNDGNSTVDVASRTATLQVDPGEKVKCTFTNSVSAPPPPPPGSGCPATAMITSFRSKAVDKQFVDITNVGSSEITLDGCALVSFDVQTEESIGEATVALTGSLGSLETLRVASAGVTSVDLEWPVGAIPTHNGSLSLVSGPPPLGGTPIADAQEDITTILIYLSKKEVYGFNHWIDESLNDIYSCIYGDYPATIYPFTPVEDCAGVPVAARMARTEAEMEAVELGDLSVLLDGAREAAKAEADAEALFEAETPSSYALEANYPNPFNPQTMIRFGLPDASDVRLVVYDVLGRQVQVLVDGRVAAGWHEVVFAAGALPSGTYLYRLETPTGSFTQRMLLVK